MYNHQVLINLNFSSEAEVLNAFEDILPSVFGFINEKASFAFRKFFSEANV